MRSGADWASGAGDRSAGYPAWRVPSGAGHDGVMLSSLTPIAMLFVRCKGGISHNPAEFWLPSKMLLLRLMF